MLLLIFKFFNYQNFIIFLLGNFYIYFFFAIFGDSNFLMHVL